MSARYATNFQNRLVKAFTTLAALDQHEQLLTQQSIQSVEHLTEPKNIVQVSIEDHDASE